MAYKFSKRKVMSAVKKSKGNMANVQRALGPNVQWGKAKRLVNKWTETKNAFEALKNAVKEAKKPVEVTAKDLGGRPRIWATPEELQKAVDEYFDGTGKKTICGLALALNFNDRQSLYDYRDRRDAFSAIIKKAMLKVEEKYEERLSGPHATGSIFGLKNMGWKDKHEVDATIKGDLDAPITVNVVGGGNKDETGK